MFTLLVAWKLLSNTVQRWMFCKLPPGKTLTSLLWFSRPFASHKSGKNLSWMAQGKKYVQGCVKAAFLIGTFSEQKLWSAAVCTRGKKETKWQGKGANWGLSQIPCVGPLRGLRSTAHLLGLFILGRALENLSMAALTRDFSSADSRRSPSSQPLTPLSPILSNLDREFSFAFSAQRWYWILKSS